MGAATEASAAPVRIPSLLRPRASNVSRHGHGNARKIDNDEFLGLSGNSLPTLVGPEQPPTMQHPPLISWDDVWRAPCRERERVDVGDDFGALTQDACEYVAGLSHDDFMRDCQANGVFPDQDRAELKKFYAGHEHKPWVP